MIHIEEWPCFRLFLFLPRLLSNFWFYFFFHCSIVFPVHQPRNKWWLCRCRQSSSHYPLLLLKRIRILKFLTCCFVDSHICEKSLTRLFLLLILVLLTIELFCNCSCRFPSVCIMLDCSSRRDCSLNWLLRFFQRYASTDILSSGFAESCASSGVFFLEEQQTLFSIPILISNK